MEKRKTSLKEAREEAAEGKAARDKTSLMNILGKASPKNIFRICGLKNIFKKASTNTTEPAAASPPTSTA